MNVVSEEGCCKGSYCTHISSLEWQLNLGFNDCDYRKAVLVKWKEVKGVNATYGKLLQVCCEVDTPSVAEVICYVLRSRVHGEYVDASVECFAGSNYLYNNSACVCVVCHTEHAD